MGKTTIIGKLGLLFWKLYVKLYWKNNKKVQMYLDKNVGKNLGYFLLDSGKFAEYMED